MARDGKRRRQAPEVALNLSEKEVRERTAWLLFNFDMETGKYIDGKMPPWERRKAEQEGGGDGA